VREKFLDLVGYYSLFQAATAAFLLLSEILWTEYYPLTFMCRMMSDAGFESRYIDGSTRSALCALPHATQHPIPVLGLQLDNIPCARRA
jgi:hypothetical protein